jgi:hypothetical protein
MSDGKKDTPGQSEATISRRDFMAEVGAKAWLSGFGGLLIGGVLDPENRKRNAAAREQASAKTLTQATAAPQSPKSQGGENSQPMGAAIGAAAGLAGCAIGLARKPAASHQQAEETRAAAPENGPAR